MNNLKISTRLTLLVGSLCLLLAAVGGFGLYSLGRSNEALRSVYADNTVPTAQLAEVKALTMHNQQMLLESLVDPRPQVITANLARIDANSVSITQTWAAYTATSLTPEEKGLATRFVATRQQFLGAALQPAKEALRAGRIDDARRIALDVMPAEYAPLSASIAALTKLQIDVAHQEYEKATALYANVRMLTLVAIGFVVLFAAGFGWLLTRSLVRALGAEPNAVKDVADAVAGGDLSRQLTLRPGDTSSVMAVMKRMSESLSSTVASVRQNADSVAIASAQISAGNSDLSSRTEQQASALEETASSMEELSATVRHNADSATQANQLAKGASDVASRGGAVVAQVVHTMKDINDSSKKIVEIISVIDGIAFQTNILALNAAVEAARAGDQGRGFAVVATEVRSLAQRSADAAKQIKTLITASVERVEQGTALVDQAGTTMQEVVSSIRRVTDIMGEITAASAEQSVGVAQINEAVTQMDQVTQQNAALVEQSAAAAESLSQQAALLVQAVSVFRLGDGAADAPAAPTAASRSLQGRPTWPAAERRRPNRAKNVARPAFESGPTPAANHSGVPAKPTGTDADGSSF